jgi:hypothetical protein
MQTQGENVMATVDEIKRFSKRIFDACEEQESAGNDLCLKPNVDMAVLYLCSNERTKSLVNTFLTCIDGLDEETQDDRIAMKIIAPNWGGG